MVKQNRKSSVPTIYTKDIFEHVIEISIPKDKIASIVGFEVVREPKSRIDVQ